mgnify:CR=1 FL=1
MKIAKEWLDFLREQYPAGSRIQLREIGSDPAPIPPGSMGTLDYIDDAGQFQISWDKGRSLALVIGADRFTVLPPEPALLKLYMPLTADFYPRDEWGDSSEEGERWDDRTLTEYEDQILGALVKNRMPEERERGLMHWYGEQDSLNAKVRSAEFTVEVRDGCLWGVAECQVVGELTSGELTRLKDFISGQASDGWGEGFEQREIDVGDGKLYVHFWQDHDFELKRDVPDMTEFNKLLNRPKKPKMQLIGQDGNIFAIMGRASRLLKNAGQSDKAKEMCDRVTASQSYSEALNIVSEYVETELSPTPAPKRDRGDAR